MSEGVSDKAVAELVAELRAAENEGTLYRNLVSAIAAALDHPPNRTTHDLPEVVRAMRIENGSLRTTRYHPEAATCLRWKAEAELLRELADEVRTCLDELRRMYPDEHKPDGPGFRNPGNRQLASILRRYDAL